MLFMMLADEPRPYRHVPRDAFEREWEEKRLSSTETLFVRIKVRTPFASGAAATLPILVIAKLWTGSFFEMTPLAWILLVALVIGIVMLWPLPREIIRMTPERFVWRDRVVGARAILATERLGFQLEELAGGPVLLATDGDVRVPIARGELAELVQLKDVFDSARMRAMRARTPHSRGARS